MDGSRFIRFPALIAALALGACKELPSAPAGNDDSFPAFSYAPGTIASGLGTAVVDGVFTPGEWASAARVSLQVPNSKGPVLPLTWLVMNDADNLYFALRFSRDMPGYQHSATWMFDEDFDSFYGQVGDDLFGYTMQSAWEIEPIDAVVTVDESIFRDDRDDLGTIDVVVAQRRRADGLITVEISHPLLSADSNGVFHRPGYSRDIKVTPGEATGVSMHFGFWKAGVGGGELFHPTVTQDWPWWNYVRLQTARAGNAPVPVALRMMYDSWLPILGCLNPDLRFGVAIVADPRFDISAIDHATVRLAGAAEHHKGPDGKPVRHVTDFDRDGDVDLLFHFRLGDTRLDCSSTVADLTGMTWSGIPVTGSGEIFMARR